MDPVLPSRRAGFNTVNCGRYAPLSMRHIDVNKTSEAKNDVHRHAGGDDRHTLAHRLILKRSRIVITVHLIRSFADHFYVAAQGDEPDLVSGFAPAEAAAGNGRP